MDADEIIQRRAAQELRDGMLVNLGIGMPTGVSQYLPKGITVHFQSENGIVGMGARPPEGMEDADLTDAGGGFVTAVPGAATVDSVLSFGLIRGGHLDMTVLGGMQVNARGQLANWMIPGKMVAGMGGAMDLVSGARRVLVTMNHTAKGHPKIVPELTMPITSVRPVSLIITELAVIEPTAEGLLLLEHAPGIGIDEVLARTAAPLKVAGSVKVMALGG
jgi:acetate CoA/acetoacetate CoA-transferase beta subunit